MPETIQDVSTAAVKKSYEEEPEREWRLNLHLDSIINVEEDFSFSPQVVMPNFQWIDSLIAAEPQNFRSETHSRQITPRHVIETD
jgi:hypothetical protein